MLSFFVLSLAVLNTVLANPIPQILDEWNTDDPSPTPIEESLEIVSFSSFDTTDNSTPSSDPNGSEYAECPPNTSSGLSTQNIDSTSETPRDFSDENLNSSQDIDIFRRNPVACPAGRPLEQNAQNDIRPFTRKGPPPEPPEKKVIATPPGACANMGLPVLVTCGGPQVLNKKTGLVDVVANCILGKCFILL